MPPNSGESGIVIETDFVVNKAENGNPVFRMMGEET
jgi:hypothetical protein